MKKQIILLIIMITLLCGCSHKEYKLIELSSDELSTYLSENEDASITVAFTNSEEENNTQYLEDLTKIAKRTKENIYYIDGSHVSSMASIILYDVYQINYEKLSYLVLQDGKQIKYEDYTDYDTTYKDLNGKKYSPNITYNDEETINKYLQEAQSLYEEGKISESLDTLNIIWNQEQAKEYYEEHPYYNLIGNWELYTRGTTDDEVKYTSFIFSYVINEIYYYNKSIPIEGFTKPDMNEYKYYYYYLKDDKIYISNDESKNYKVKYTITSLTKDTLVLEDGKKTYKLSKE